MTDTVECPDCREPGEKHIVFLDGRDANGRRTGWQEWRTCQTCGGTHQIDPLIAWKRMVGHRVREKRVHRGNYETHKEAAARLGMDFVAYSQLESGRL